MGRLEKQRGRLGVAKALRDAKSVSIQDEEQASRICKRLHSHPACSTVRDKNGNRMCVNRRQRDGTYSKTRIECVRADWNGTHSAEERESAWEDSDDLGRKSKMLRVDLKTPLREEEKKRYARYMAKLNSTSSEDLKYVKRRLQQNRLHWVTEENMKDADPTQRHLWALSLTRTDL